VIKVLIVDDSAVIRRLLSTEISKAPDIEVVGTATDPYVARDKIVALEPDVLTLDIEMPRMDGLTFLEKLMQHFPMPVVVVSTLTEEGSETAIRALELGAVDVVGKPSSAKTWARDAEILIDRIRIAARTRCTRSRPAVTPVEKRPRVTPSLAAACHRLVAIGASTGGTEAIKAVLQQLPATTPGTLIVLHMPAQFTTAFARRLDTLCPMHVREASGHDRVVPGLALVAPGDHHMVVRRCGADYFADLKDGPRVHYQRPAVDVLFQSVARHVGRDALGVLLTGMGADGANGLLAMRRSGACTLVQNEESCVVFGMPKEAIARGAAEAVVPLDQMGDEIIRRLLVAAHAPADPLAGRR
jgi:two-component system chemotaxis response regulator CheB